MIIVAKVILVITATMAAAISGVAGKENPQGRIFCWCLSIALGLVAAFL